ncbi:hypothetical protein R1flu_019594 [Riccia fluitans]|uniref:Uncharacterized protein n=1 Tax=Riccia fluitans TaxID=41844 RepID=A0ABD1ZJ39_9MARC
MSESGVRRGLMQKKPTRDETRAVAIDSVIVQSASRVANSTLTSAHSCKERKTRKGGTQTASAGGAPSDGGPCCPL